MENIADDEVDKRIRNLTLDAIFHQLARKQVKNEMYQSRRKKDFYARNRERCIERASKYYYDKKSRLMNEAASGTQNKP